MDTSTRLLRLLSLLSGRAHWTAAELSGETGTTERTVRRDITRLRDLGYPVEATTGPYGGYTLGRGGHLPPLVLDDDEAVAVAVGLRAGAGGSTGTESAALSALVKLDQVLPARLAEQVSAVAAVTVGLRQAGLPPIDVGALVTTALACRRPERLRFTYRDGSDRVTRRLVEPYRLVYTDRRWYLMAHDADRADWRTFRVDRMEELSLTGTRFVQRDDTPDAAAFVSRGLAVAMYAIKARVLLHAPLEEAKAFISPTVGLLEPETDETTIVSIGGEPDWIARFLAGLECRFEVLEPDDVRSELRALGRRLVRDHS